MLHLLAPQSGDAALPVASSWRITPRGLEICKIIPLAPLNYFDNRINFGILGGTGPQGSESP